MPIPGKILNAPPAHITNAAANYLNCAITSLAGPVGYTQTQPYIVVNHIRIVNTDTVAHTITLYKGATAGSAGGTEFAFKAVSIPANSYVDWYGKTRFDAADFLSGLADVTNVLTINIDADISLA